MIFPANAKLFGGGLAAVALIAAGIWANGCYTRSVIQDQLVIAGIVKGGKHLDSVKVQHDTVYRVDTMQLRTANTVYRPLAAAARKTPTDSVAVLKALNACDTAIKAAAVVITACEQRVSDRDAIIRNRDSLVTELRKPIPIPRISYDVGGLYDVARRESILRSGAEFRAFFDFRGRVEAEYNDVKGFSARVGIRKVF